MRPTRASLAATLAGALVATALAGCTTPNEIVAEDAVDDLVADLASGSFDSGVILDPTDAEIWHAYALGPLIDVNRTVEAGDVVVDGDTAEVALTWTFHLAEGDLTVPAHATLAHSAEEWHLSWEPTVLDVNATDDSRYVLTRIDGGYEVTLTNASDDGSGQPGDRVLGTVGG